MNTLNKFKSGDTVLVEKIICKDNVCQRLGELGLYIGAEIHVIKNDNFSPIVLKILDSQIALGLVEAQNIYGVKI